MTQVTLRVDDTLADDVRRAARRDGKSINAWVSDVLRVAVDPDHEPPGMERVRERLRRAGLLAPAAHGPVPRPPADEVAAARAQAGAGTPLTEFVTEGRR